jgi:hypothetical protein
MHYFDYETVAREAGIAGNQLDQLLKLFTLEEPTDPMLAELHLLRTCMAIKSGRLTLDEALNEARKLGA